LHYNKSEENLQNLSIAREAARKSVVTCHICGKEVLKGGIKQHTRACENGRNCPVCGKWFYSKGVTCSHGCANTFFRSGMSNPNVNENSYRVICFHHHERQCVVCGEALIVEVHHIDEDHSNNSPENLLPLCPTHHQYVHSKHRHLVQGAVNKYVESEIV